MIQFRLTNRNRNGSGLKVHLKSAFLVIASIFLVQGLFLKMTTLQPVKDNLLSPTESVD